MAVRKCPDCGGEISRSAVTCLHCNANLAVAEPPVTPPQPDPTSAPTVYDNSYRPIAPTAYVSSGFADPSFAPNPDEAKIMGWAVVLKKWTVKIIVGCAVLTAIFTVLILSQTAHDPPPLPTNVAGMIGPDGSPYGGGTSTSMPVVANTPDGTNASTTTAVTDTNQTGDNGEVANYVGFLQRIDSQRLSLAASAAQISPTASLPDYNSLTQALLQDFLAQKPPKECTTVDNAYYTLIRDQSDAIVRRANAAKSADQNGVTQTWNSDVDKLNTEAAAADQALSQLCNDQKVPKAFAIQSGVAAIQPGTQPIAPTNPSQPMSPQSPTTSPSASTA